MKRAKFTTRDILLLTELLRSHGIMIEVSGLETAKEFVQLLRRHGIHGLELFEIEVLADVLLLLDAYGIRPIPTTPTSITFKELSMNSATAGNTLIYTGTLAPSGAAFPAGTTFSVTSSDPTVSPTVDPTGLIVTVPLPTTFSDDPANPLTLNYTAGGFTPVPTTSPTSITATITPTVPTPPTPTPTGITFAQTT